MEIKGFESYDISENGIVTNLRTGRILKFDLSGPGYPRVTLSQDNKLRRITIHRLVALHYILNPDNLPMVNHIDGVKTNNHVSNLEWVDCKGNTAHAFRTGLRPSAEKHYNAELTNELVEEVCKELSCGKTRGEILSQERFQSVTKHQFDDIRRRRSWKTISHKYDWERATTRAKARTPK